MRLDLLRVLKVTQDQSRVAIEKMAITITTNHLLGVFQLVSICGSCFILYLLISDEGISVLTSRTDWRSLKADDSDTTIGKKRSLLIEPMTERKCKVGFQG